MNPPIVRCSRRPLVILALVGALALGPLAASAADHLDGPRLMANPTVLGNLDINDVYIFKAFNPKNTVLIMTLSPAAGVLGPAMFNPMGMYQFEIENNNDTSPDLTIQFTFAAPGVERASAVPVRRDRRGGDRPPYRGRGFRQEHQGDGQRHGAPGPLRRPVLLRPQRLQQVQGRGPGRQSDGGQRIPESQRVEHPE